MQVAFRSSGGSGGGSTMQVDPDAVRDMMTARVESMVFSEEIPVIEALAADWGGRLWVQRSSGVPGEDGLGPFFLHTANDVVEVARGDTPDVLVLGLRYPLEPYACEAVAAATELGIPARVHIHYAQASFPRIVDESDNPLADTGAWWVSASFGTTRPGAFPDLDPAIEIPCP